MPAQIFISYRRSDAGGHAGRLRDRLAHWFDAESLFYDQGNIDSGEHFPKVLDEGLTGATVLLVVIGPEWENILAERAKLPALDWVRREVETGLARAAAGEQALIPLLLGRETLPNFTSLPESLQALAEIEVHRFIGKDADWQLQFMRLLDKLKTLPGMPSPRFRSPAGMEQPFRLIDHVLSPHFQDPHGQLGQLRETLAGGQRVALVARAAIYGMGGLGKTQLALKYSHDFRDRYAGVWWFRAEHTELLETDAAACCEEVAAPQREGEAPSAALKRWLAGQPAAWLLVYDNAEEPSVLRPLLPDGDRHHVLLTSRNPAWGGLAEPLRLETWSEEEGADFLHGRLTGRRRDDLRTLSADLGGLPLALEQAASYLEETGMAIAEYRQLLAGVDTGALVLDTGHASTGYERSVAATLCLAFTRLAPAAQELLRLASFAAPEPLPERFLLEAADRLPDALAAVAANPLTWQATVAELRRYGLAERIDIQALDASNGKREHALTLHRLTQQVVRAMLADAPRDAEALLAALHAALPEKVELPVAWPCCAALWPHGVNLARFPERIPLDPVRLRYLWDRIAIYLQRGPALYLQAKHLFERALALSRNAFGEEHQNTLTSMSNLALTLWAQGDLCGARALQEQELSVCRRVLGEEHPDTLTSMSNLALTLRAQGDLVEARALNKQALAVRRRVLGEEHPDTLVSMNNLAVTVREHGDLSGARALNEQALVVRRRVLGEEHPDTLASMNNLAGTVLEQGDLSGARVLNEQALAVRQRVLGEEHPDTAISAWNLFGTLHQAGDTGAASAVLREHLQWLVDRDPAELGGDLRAIRGFVRELAGFDDGESSS
ncbi:FxSxx-COOH system tetratricopeptide repeat protein [Candidatus Accumulibacter sp. ACC007]|uniref:FxSxx-COOH system tetratricopeptide repeat protein n=1 Tax=Candidatus Accumulibacter sp. ACC007 TaxID=2823333 RepID=UPI0025C1E786|nr:FxSxx-COOH system tetratricopeptide repeat protein [Candidatus Accumulibacter sp. ACC007]